MLWNWKGGGRETTKNSNFTIKDCDQNNALEKPSYRPSAKIQDMNPNIKLYQADFPQKDLTPILAQVWKANLVFAALIWRWA